MKINLSRSFDPEKFIRSATDLGVTGARELGNLLSDILENVVSVLRNGITIEDNVDAKIRNVILKDNVITSIGMPDPLKKVKHIIPTQVRPFTAGLKTFNWQYNVQGEIEIRATFDPPTNASVSLQLVLLF